MKNVSFCVNCNRKVYVNAENVCKRCRREGFTVPQEDSE